MDGYEQAVPLASGDLVLFAQGQRSYQLQDAPDSSVRPMKEVVRPENWRPMGTRAIRRRRRPNGVHLRRLVSR